MSIPVAETGAFRSRDGVDLHFDLYTAAQPRAGVILVHGFAEHCGRYQHLVGELVPAGLSVFAYDARGHGKSGGTRVFVSQFKEYTDDLAEAVAFAGAKLPRPLLLFGHSMGGLVALRLLEDVPDLVHAVAITNPALHNSVIVPAWKEVLAKVASRLAPKLAIPSGIDPAGISRDLVEVKAYAEDPLNSKMATARWYTEYLLAQKETLARARDLRAIPLLCLVGDGDPIIDAKTTMDFVKRIGGPDTVLENYPGFYHELLNEPAADRAKVAGRVRAWFEAHLS